MTILIIDDDVNNLQVLYGHLRLAGYQVLVAQDGENGIGIAEQERPSLILLDILMPELNGFETCRQLKANPSIQHIPVIFMTALTDIKNTVKGFDVGAVDYITKPFRQAELLARVATHLKLQQLQNDLAEQNEELQATLAKINELSGLLPICANCKKIRDDEGYWQEVEEYIREHSSADFTHGFCPGCIQELYPSLFDD